jgi:NADH dehydrogenase [ubiquinone] 1 alpha subcomplex assembly factor 1
VTIFFFFFLAVFSGKLSLDCQPTEVGIVRSGYCAVRTSIPYGIHLHGFEGLAMRIMTDGRT